jgi:hypothetical protein
MIGENRLLSIFGASGRPRTAKGATVPFPGPAASARQPTRIRPACAADGPALAEMLSRCTASTRSLRFNAPLKRLIEHADRSELRTLTATMLVEQEWIMRPLRAYGTCTAVMSKGVLEVTVHRRADPASRKAPVARAQ